MSYKMQEVLNHGGHLGIWRGVCCDVRYYFYTKMMFGTSFLQLFVNILMSYLYYLCLFRVAIFPKISTWKRCSVRLSPHLIVEGIMFYLCYLLFSWFSSCLLCAQYFQCLWIVHSWLAFSNVYLIKYMHIAKIIIENAMYM